MNAAYKYDIMSKNDYDVITSRKGHEAIGSQFFDLGSAVKGLANMNHKRNLSSYAEGLVATYATYSCDQYELSLEMLPENEQNELARLYIESIDRDIEWACYGDDHTLNSSFLCALLAMLQDDNEDTREHFAKMTRKNVLVYYKNSLEEELITACDNYLNNAMNEQGYYAHTDMEHGDIVWSKF